jgi:hypothetical protein
VVSRNGGNLFNHAQFGASRIGHPIKVRSTTNHLVLDRAAADLPVGQISLRDSCPWASPASARAGQNRLRQNRNFASHFSVDAGLPVHTAKYFASVFRKYMLEMRIPPRRGAMRIVTKRAAGCDGRELHRF